MLRYAASHADIFAIIIRFADSAPGDAYVAAFHDFFSRRQRCFHFAD